MKKPKTWFLVADGTLARIVRDLEQDPETGPHPEDIVLEMEHKPLRRIMADRPGRSFASYGARRSAMEYRSDPIRERQVRFAAMLIRRLEKLRIAHAFDRLVIVAEPQMLGILREALPQALKALVVGEVDKDLSRLPPRELYKALADLGATAGIR
ncbi:host attachment protein [Chelativorans alearense]|uniref:host attachment protein n=1 Tax=Chelativorans alearense TaxID=2681495 RepID=UPI0013D835E6|nr:host attachment protein [Chelativorans alearense]